jgi:hypothetical protein
MARITSRASPSKNKFPQLEDVANLEVKRAAETSPRSALVEVSFWVIDRIILPFSSLITAAATTKSPWIAASKFPLIHPAKGGVHREGN